MMKKFIRLMSFLLAAVILAVGFTVNSFAADSNVIFENKAEKFIFLPGSEYTDTDLFPNFKNMMPGDTLRQTVVVSNNFKGFEKVKIFLRALPHGLSNLLSLSVSERETFDTMNDFLSQLTMTIRKGTEVIFHGSPNETGALTYNVELGTIAYGDMFKLDVELEMPIELGNEYANRIGEVDWVFTVQQVVDTPILPQKTSATITAVKLLDGNVPSSNEFMFSLTDSNGKVLQTTNNNGIEVFFRTLDYTAPGVYTYYLQEIPGGNLDITYDPSIYTVNVTVVNMGGFLVADVSYLKDGVPYTGVPTFNNVTDKEDPDATSVSIWAMKTLNQHLATEGDFKFDLYDSEGNIIQIKNNVGGYIFFDRLHFDKPGIYHYFITEQKGSVEGMIYDFSEFKVTVNVTEVNGKLQAVVSYEKNGLEYIGTPTFNNTTEDDPEIPGTSDSNLWFICIIGIMDIIVMVLFIVFKTKNKAK